MTEPDDEVEIECWWETATTLLDLDADALEELGMQPDSAAAIRKPGGKGPDM